MDEDRLEESIIKLLLIIILCANFFGAIELYQTNIRRFYISVLPTLFSQFLLLIFNRKIKPEKIASSLGFLLIYTSITTSIFGDLTQDYNNPLIPIMMGIILVGVFSYKRVYTIAIIVVSLLSIVFYSYRRSLGSGEINPAEVYIAYSLHLIVISLIAFSTTLMNYKRYKYQLQIESSNKRMIAGEKLRGSEIIMPAISHDISGPLGNAKILSDVVLVELKEANFKDSAHIIDSVDLLNKSLTSISSVINRYKNLTLPKNKSSNTYSFKAIVEQVEKYLKLVYPNINSFKVINNEDINIVNGISTLPVLKDLIENSISHNLDKEVTITISWENDTKGDLIIKVADNGKGFKDPDKYLETPVLSSFKGVSKTCLGLYLSRLRIEHSFGGKILLFSSNSGTTGEIHIPIEFVEASITA